MPEEPNRLGTFLRARRALVSPDQVGVTAVGTRRVAGLRREEVAMLAGISADYYLRLEQGRDRRPSVQVLRAIATALQLDDEGIEYLLGLAADKPARTRRPRREVVPRGTSTLVATLPMPAFVEGRYLDVLASNPLAVALSPRLAVGGNRLRDVFLDRAEQAMFPQSERAASALLAGFRASVGSDVDDPRVIELVGELSVASPLFRRLWARHDVGPRQGAEVALAHPQVGELRLYREKLVIGGTDRMTLVIYHSVPGSKDADKLTLLAALAATPAAT